MALAPHGCFQSLGPASALAMAPAPHGCLPTLAPAMALAPHGCLPTLAPATALASHGCLPTLHGNGEHPPTPAPAMALGMALSLRGLFRTLAPAMEPAVALQHEGERTRRRFRVLRRAKAKDRHRLLPRGGGGRLLL